jgi:hypothetical protein
MERIVKVLEEIRCSMEVAADLEEDYHNAVRDGRLGAEIEKEVAEMLLSMKVLVIELMDSTWAALDKMEQN